MSALIAQTRTLPYNPVTAEYSNALDRIIFIAANPNQLHIFDPVNNSDTAVNLPKAPLSLSISLDGMHAAVGHDALISYVNLQTASLEKTLASTSTVTSLVLGNDYVYVLTYSSGTQWVQISTGASGSYGIYTGSAGRLHPSGTAIYTTDDGITPETLRDLNVSTGPVTAMNGGPYTGDYPVCGGVWFSPDGSRVYVGCAMAYQANPQDATLGINFLGSATLDRKADGLYWTPFAGTSQIRSLTESATLGRIAIIPPNQGYISPPVKDNQVLLYDSAYLEPAGLFQLPDFEINGKSYPAHGQQAFYNQASAALFVVVQAEPASPLPNPFAVEIFPVGDPPPCAPTFSAARSTLAAAGTIATVDIKAPATCIYQASSTVDWIQLISGAYGSGNGTLTFVVRPNSGAERTGDIKLGGQTYAVTQPAAPAPSNAFMRLGYSVAGAGYSKSLDKVIAIVSDPKELHILDPISASDRVVPLPKPPFFLSVSPDGLSAAVGFAGWVSIVDLSTATITSTVQVFTDAHTLVMAGNGYLYAYPQNAVGNQFSTQIATGNINLANATYDGRYPQLYIDGTAFYTEGSKWDISEGPASLINENFSACAPFWLTEDGNRMITSCGKAYTTSPVPALDVQYNGSFSNATSIQWAAESVKWHSTAVIPSAMSGTDNSGDEFLQMYGDVYLGYAGDLSLHTFTVGSTAYAGHGRYVFWNGSEDNLIVLEQADSTADLTADYAVAVYHLTTLKADCSYSLGADSGSFDNNGGLNTVSVSTGAACTWDAVPDVSWITVDSGAIGFGSNSVEYSVAPNSGSMSRIGSVVIGGQHFIVVQGGSASSGKFINAVEPSSGSGSKKTFTVVYSDTAGAASLKSVSASFSIPDATTNSCALSYSVAANQISLLDDASTASTTATPGMAATLQNSQCALDVAGVTATSNGHTLILTLPMTFEPAYAGAKNIYLSATDISGAQSGSQKQGTWTIP